MSIGKEFLFERGLLWDNPGIGTELEDCLSEKAVTDFLEAIQSKDEHQLQRMKNITGYMLFGGGKAIQIYDKKKFFNFIKATTEMEMIPDELFDNERFRYYYGDGRLRNLKLSQMEAVCWETYEQQILSCYPEYKLKRIFNLNEAKMEYRKKFCERMADACLDIYDRIDEMVKQELLLIVVMEKTIKSIKETEKANA